MKTLVCGNQNEEKNGSNFIFTIEAFKSQYENEYKKGIIYSIYHNRFMSGRNMFSENAER